MALHYKKRKYCSDNFDNFLVKVLKNRGIESPQDYLSLDESALGSWEGLCNIEKAIDVFDKHIEQRHTIMVMPDEDCDGYTSSAMIYNFLKSIDPDYPVTYKMHTEFKSHGLDREELSDFSGAQLVIIADAGTNDAEQCNALITQGIDVIILDHHNPESEASLNLSIIVNNQMSDEYENKELSGAGIVYQFLRGYSETTWNGDADDFLDLCALGNIADLMDVRSKETRYLINKGLETIRNPFFAELIQKQEYRMKNVVNIHNVAWYIAPLINAVSRQGSLEERTLVFRAFIGETEVFDYKKRDGSIVKETLLERAARIASNVKGRQDNKKKKFCNTYQAQIDPDEKFIILESQQDISGLSGAIANKFAADYEKPTIVLNEADKNGIHTGSGRNYNHSPIENLQELLQSTGAFEFCQGHDNAFGVGIKHKNIPVAIERLRELLKDTPIVKTYYIDFILDGDEFSSAHIINVHDYSHLWGNGIDEPQFLLTNIKVANGDIEVMGMSGNAVKFEYNGVVYVQFNVKEGDALFDVVNDWDMDNDTVITLNVIGTTNINDYQGVLTPQLVIQDAEKTSRPLCNSLDA